MDRSNGYEGVSEHFLARRGRAPSVGIGVKEVRSWARTLPPGSSIIDLGSGPGFPITAVLVEEGLNVSGVPILCEAVQDSGMFNRTFDSVLAWGLMFLLTAKDQQRLIHRFAEVLAPGGRLLFTSPAKPAVWKDGMTDLESVSLGAGQYKKQLAAVSLAVIQEFDDEGENHYFDVLKRSVA
jgi:SAM-dependent methyltransferase